MFTRTASYTLRIASLFLLLCFSARAETIAQTIAENMEVSTGIFCDTQKQVERLVELFDKDAETAMKRVNVEERNPTACGVATIVFVRAPEVTTTRTAKGTFNIVRILILGVITDAGFRSAVPAAYFSVEKIDERRA